MDDKLYKALKAEMELCATAQECAEADDMLLLIAIYREQHAMLKRIINRYDGTAEYSLELHKGKATIMRREKRDVK